MLRRYRQWSISCASAGASATSAPLCRVLQCRTSHYVTPDHRPLVSYFDDAQQNPCSDECRMLFGRPSGVHSVAGDVPCLVEESFVARTITSSLPSHYRRPGDDAEGDVSARIEMEAHLSGLSVMGTSFDMATEVVIANANRQVQEHLATATSSGIASGIAAAAGGGVFDRRVWATEDEMAEFGLTRCPLLPNTVEQGRTGLTLFRTTTPWYAARLFTPFSVQTLAPVSPRVRNALRRWCMLTQSWWSVWGTAAEYRDAGIELLDQPIEVHVINEWGDALAMVSAYSCVRPEDALRHVFGSHPIL